MYKVSEELEQLAQQVMDQEPDVAHLRECKICYLLCDKEKRSSKIVYADTEKVKDKYKGIMDFDFIITFYEPVIRDLNDEKMKILMWHELKHVGFDGENCKINPHTLEDFKDLVIRYGADWID